MKGLRITKNVKEIKFEGVRGKLESITITQENIIIENIIIEIAHKEKSLISIFQEFSTGIGGAFILVEGLGLVFHCWGSFLVFLSFLGALIFSWGGSFMPCLWVVVAHVFTCGEGEIW